MLYLTGTAEVSIATDVVPPLLPPDADTPPASCATPLEPSVGKSGYTSTTFAVLMTVAKVLVLVMGALYWPIYRDRL